MTEKSYRWDNKRFYLSSGPVGAEFTLAVSRGEARALIDRLTAFLEEVT